MHENHMNDCIKACDDAAKACDFCVSACLTDRNVAEMAACIKLSLDCAELCRLGSALMSRGSQFAGEVANLCAVACDACAADCEKHKDMAHCAACAEACRRCAAACRKMAA